MIYLVRVKFEFYLIVGDRKYCFLYGWRIIVLKVRGWILIFF